MNVRSDIDATVHVLDEHPRAFCGRSLVEGETWWATEEELTCQECRDAIDPDEDGPGPDLNPEGDPTRNGATDDR